MIRRMARRFQHLIGEVKIPEALGVDRDQSALILLPDGWVAVLAVAEERQDPTEQPREQR